MSQISARGLRPRGRGGFKHGIAVGQVKLLGLRPRGRGGFKLISLDELGAHYRLRPRGRGGFKLYSHSGAETDRADSAREGGADLSIDKILIVAERHRTPPARAGRI